MGPARVKPGDIVTVDYTCRLRNGEVVFTTEEAVAKQKETRASIFLPLREYRPEDIVAGGPDDKPRSGNLKAFEYEVSWRVAQAVVGMKAGEQAMVVLKSEPPGGLSDSDRYITLSRVLRMPKERRVPVETLKKQLGHDSVAGEQAFSFNGFTGTVFSINGNEAVLKISVTDGRVVDQPFGKGIVRDYPDHYDIVTQAEVGHLVRSAELVGRIIKTDEKTFTVDYGHPFGGEELECDVKVESILAGTPGGKRMTEENN